MTYLLRPGPQPSHRRWFHVYPALPSLRAVILKLSHFLPVTWLLFHPPTIDAEAPRDWLAEFATAKYKIEMRVSFPPPYEGERLVVYSSHDPRREDCLPIVRGVSGCTENFVGAVAVVVFTVSRIAYGQPAETSIREVVTVVDQSAGLPDRPPFTMSVRLIDGRGSDLQVFGYDESPAPPAARPIERERAKGAWRRYRQELYIDKDREPFAVIQWLHSTTGIRILQVESGVLSNLSNLTQQLIARRR
jgi:hypothetical protein